MAGRFITFEGGEGAGKSTQIRRLAARLAATGRVVATTREPGGTPTAETIRKLILSGSAEALGPDAEAILFAAARADHVERVIRPALAGGEWVLSDRFYDSTHVYQGATGGVDEVLLRTLDRVAVGETRPDLTIVLDVPAAIGLARAAARPVRAGSVPDRFEREKIELHERRRQAYLEIAIAEPERVAVVDATRTEDEVSQAIWDVVTARLLRQAA